jgi:hypothetical protein
LQIVATNVATNHFSRTGGTNEGMLRITQKFLLFRPLPFIASDLSCEIIDTEMLNILAIAASGSRRARGGRQCARLGNATKLQP